MSSEPQEKTEQRAENFAREAQEARPGLVREFWDFVRHTKKWWLVPILVILLLVGLIIILGTTAAGPFIYTLF